MATKKSELGRLGEDIACQYLVDKGYKIIERNYRQPWGEIDIIAKYKDGTLVFVEVKTMEQYRGGIRPEDQLTGAKILKLQRTAALYAGHYPEKIRDDKGWRIDLIAINTPQDLSQSVNLTDIIKVCDIRHYENI
jgi:putative endonuclease